MFHFIIYNDLILSHIKILMLHRVHFNSYFDYHVYIVKVHMLNIRYYFYNIHNEIKTIKIYFILFFLNFILFNFTKSILEMLISQLYICPWYCIIYLYVYIFYRLYTIKIFQDTHF